jgi:dUTP pyrophosphatase
MMKVKKLVENAILPTKAHAGDLGYDLYTSAPMAIFPGEVKLVSTGISVQFPEGYGALIRDRSSVATKQYLFVVAGVIDNGYTGEIKIALYNGGGDVAKITEGTKIAQMILVPTVNFDIEEVTETTSADGRGSNGFGSTGS